MNSYTNAEMHEIAERWFDLSPKEQDQIIKERNDKFARECPF